MSVKKSLIEWGHRRYCPWLHWYQQAVPYGVEMGGDPLVPPKGWNTSWRGKWSWAVVHVSPGYDGEMFTKPYHPGYSLDGRHTFRYTVLPVITTCFAFQIGPEPFVYSVFDRDGGQMKVKLTLLGAGLTWSQAVQTAGGASNLTFV